MDTLSKRLKEKSLMYSHDEFKDITDIVKVLLLDFEITFILDIPINIACTTRIFRLTGRFLNLPDPKRNTVCSFTLILTNFLGYHISD